LIAAAGPAACAIFQGDLRPDHSSGFGSDNMDERRQHARRTLSMTGWIVPNSGDQPITCRVNDISDVGAGLRLTNAEALPGSFNLFLANNFSVGRKCMIVWRSESAVGVSFTGKIVPSDEEKSVAADSSQKQNQVFEI
jgi:PilZ domain